MLYSENWPLIVNFLEVLSGLFFEEPDQLDYLNVSRLKNLSI